MIQRLTEIGPQGLSWARWLLCEYRDSLGLELSFQHFEDELAQLPGAYVAPRGGFWFVMDGDVPAGCGALREIDAVTAEMKRLYVRPSYRGKGFGQQLILHIIDRANSAGYHDICLDSVLPQMAHAVALYERLGFQRTGPYCFNPLPGAVFLRLRLE